MVCLIVFLKGTSKSNLPLACKAKTFKNIKNGFENSLPNEGKVVFVFEWWWWGDQEFAEQKICENFDW